MKMICTKADNGNPVFTMDSGTVYCLEEDSHKCTLVNRTTGEKVEIDTLKNPMDLFSKLLLEEGVKDIPDPCILVYVATHNTVVAATVREADGAANLQQLGNHHVSISDDQYVEFCLVSMEDIPKFEQRHLMGGKVLTFLNGDYAVDVARTEELFDRDDLDLPRVDDFEKVIQENISLRRPPVNYGGGYRMKPETPFWKGVHRKGNRKQRFK